ncbi:tRNA threonylcarbamoyladenosine dehydratase [Roseibacillus persicicus]|uniref:tRNA threonylcarbamoyladenosine dehydratase n=1 Tax=Roseibacillus persicicus TaxID=454148 RepID=UPI00398B481D
MTDSFLTRFSGIARLYGQQALDNFANAHVAIIGIGGVGCWVAEALARSGVGTFTFVDLDDLCVTNINRQLHAVEETIGRSKAQVMADRLRSINPDVVVHVRQEFFTEKTAENILSDSYDWVIDAIDSIKAKCLLLALCREKEIPVITSGGAGGRIRTDKIEVADLSRTHGCALLLQVRKNLRSDYGFPAGGKKAKKFKIPAVFSSEQPRYPTSDGCVSTQRPDDVVPGIRCDAGYGTATPIIGSFAFAIAGFVLNDLASAIPDEQTETKSSLQTRPSV